MAKAEVERVISTVGASNFDTATVHEMTKQAVAATFQRYRHNFALFSKEPRDATVKFLQSESDEGNVEYKLKLKDPDTGNPYRIQQLVATLRVHDVPHACCQNISCVPPRTLRSLR